MAEPPPKKSRLTLYEELLDKDTIAEMQARDAEKVAAAQAKKAKDGNITEPEPFLGFLIYVRLLT